MRAARCVSWLLGICVLTPPSTKLGAQSTVAVGGAPICPAGRAPSTDSAIVTVTVNAGTAWNSRKYSDTERQLILNYADAIRQHFVMPKSLGAVPTLAEWTHVAWGSEPTHYSAVSGRLVLVVKPNGRLREAFWQEVPFSTPLATAFYRATIEADTAHDFEGMPVAEARTVDDTLVVQLRTTENPSPATDLPLMRAQVVSYIAATPPTVLKRGPLYYPTSLTYSRVTNEGEMQVVVGSDGRAIMPASQITRLEWRDFVSTMRRAVEGSVYHPATSNGCAVPSVIVQPFSFTIRDSR